MSNLFIGEIRGGCDPRRPREGRAATDTNSQTVGAFLDAHMERCVKPAGLRSLPSIQSRASVLKRYLGELPLDAPEEPDEINRPSRTLTSPFGIMFFRKVNAPLVHLV